MKRHEGREVITLLREIAHEIRTLREAQDRTLALLVARETRAQRDQKLRAQREARFSAREQRLTKAENRKQRDWYVAPEPARGGSR